VLDKVSASASSGPAPLSGMTRVCIPLNSPKLDTEERNKEYYGEADDTKRENVHCPVIPKEVDTVMSSVFERLVVSSSKAANRLDDVVSTS
jgi:hypothetical protein